ncbi:transcriptional regulator GlxA family with amidase domain [Salirhabdus euzebyi]|uniref:Transcriptional regulator GlxA family with amidase domain n=1 Tax=Salirhabdus euzebyi TaxID=394506 RepID=A0A841Q614_9BACI|nr:DJ-1/PfpI family protein [Salirhabdus euzebyi]MBB6453825.1 transcriptional regulator GlxA family with amidase domain [Salirhabdus euzebyi]
MDKSKKVGILLYDDVNHRDVANVGDVFSLVASSELEKSLALYKRGLPRKKLFQLVTVSEKGSSVMTQSGFWLQPMYSFANAPELDIIIIPGGTLGAINTIIHNSITVNWLKKYSYVENVGSIGLGTVLLAEAGLLNKRKAVVQSISKNTMQSMYPDVDFVVNSNLVEDGNIITASGFEAGKNIALHIIKKIYGENVERFTQKNVEQGSLVKEYIDSQIY